MSKEKTKTVATRVTLEEFSKARESLISQGVKEEQLTSNSRILKTCLLMCIMLHETPKEQSSEESRDFIKQLWKETRRDKNMHLDDLYAQGE